jgi:hypothetical protein
MNSHLITNYCACSIHDTIPLHYQFNQKNIICNSWFLPEKEKEQLRNNNFILDCDNDNISYLNYTFAELTASYHIWKNKFDDVISFTHYRRFWNEKKINNINFEKTICVPNKEFLNNTAYQQFTNIHGNEGINFVESILNDNFILKKEHFLQLKNINFIYPANMVICKKIIYDKICEIKFELLFEIYKQYFLEISQKDNYQRRFIGFLSERITTIILENSEYYLGITNKKHCDLTVFQK